MANISRTTMTARGHTVDQYMAETTKPTIEIKMTMQLCTVTVVNLDILQENAIAMHPINVVVTFHPGIDMVDSSIGLALGNNMAD